MREIYLYRMIGVERMRWKFIVNKDDTIISEGPAMDVAPNEIPTPVKIEEAPSKKSTIETGQEMLASRGIKSHVKDNKIFIDYVPKKQVLIGEFLSNLGCPNSIPNCAELQKQMNEEIQNAGGARCSGCTLNSIKSKYRQILERLVSDT